MEYCSRCGVDHNRTGQRHCLPCHNAYMREWRKTHPLNEEQKKKDNARSYAGVYLRRGKLKQEPCKCGDTNSQMHHEDYNYPLDVVWMCRKCHMLEHKHMTPRETN